MKTAQEIHVSAELFDRLIERACADLAIAAVLGKAGDADAVERVREHSAWTQFLLDRRGGQEVWPNV